MNKSKKISWCWICGEDFRSVDSIGSDIRDAFNKLPKSQKKTATSNVKWIEVNGARI